MNEKPGYAALRRGRWSEAQRIYFLTTVTHRREPLFRDWHCGATMSRLLSGPELWSPADLLCWVLMPDHWHGLVSLAPGQSLALVMNRVKGSSSRQFNLATGRTRRVWADGFHDHALRRDEVLIHTARYIVANPVRAGLVARVGDYPFWDARWLVGGPSGPTT